MTISDATIYEPDPPREPGERQLRLVAILLIVFGALAILSNLYFLVSGGIQLATGHVQAPAQTQPGMTPEDYKRAFYVLMVICGVTLPLLAIMIAGAVSMLTRRRYWLAVTGAVLGILPLTAGCCCILTLPFGIWSFILLMRQDVRGLFFR